ncbi:MAG: hypothetical protein HY602_03160, partial [Parcubacteria group bacterium]|nr:hypothetical protein [Parcubacteria group bacterium]
MCIVWLMLFCALPLEAATVSEEYIGHWRGLYCKARATDQKRYGITGATYRDIGHEVSSFEFDIQEDGSIRGKGSATYWFNASASVNLFITQMKPQSYLEDKVQKR